MTQEMQEARQLTKDETEAIDLLEKVTGMVKQGGIMSVAIITVGIGGNVGLSATLTRLNELFVGASLLQDQIKGVMLAKSAAEAQRQPKILRAGADSLKGGTMPFNVCSMFR